MEISYQKKISEYLDKLGFSHALLGYGYLVQIISYGIKNPYGLRKISLAYEKVASRNRSTASSFERTIRHSILKSPGPHVPNKEFIIRAVDELKFEGFGEMELKAGAKVKMVNCLEAEKYHDIIWTTRSEPWNLCGTMVVLLDGKSGGFAVDCLEVVEDER